MLTHLLLSLIMHALCFCHCFVILSVLCFIISLLFYNKFLSLTYFISITGSLMAYLYILTFDLNGDQPIYLYLVSVTPPSN